MIKKVLVIEDNKDISTILQRRLENEGFVVEIASGGYAVLARLQKPGEPDAVILDLFIPERSGMELLNSLTSRWPHSRIFIYSAHIEYRDRLALRSYAVCGCFRKSDTSIEDLIKCIKENLEETLGNEE